MQALLLLCCALLAAGWPVSALLLLPSYKCATTSTALQRASDEGRQLLSCEWEALKRRSDVLLAEAQSGSLLSTTAEAVQDPQFAFTKWALETEVCGKADLKGRPAVQAALTRFQRMVMQLGKQQESLFDASVHCLH
jgi:hypothetical protein